jgi:capsular polysaccharide transport system permease protein
MSGIFWSLNTVPLEYHPYLTWNPILHVIEEVRSGFFTGYARSTDVSMEYVGLLAVLVIGLGMALYRQEKERLVAT